MPRKGSEVRSQWLFKAKVRNYHFAHNEKNSLYLCGCIKSLALEEKLGMKDAFYRQLPKRNLRKAQKADDTWCDDYLMRTLCKLDANGLE